jgi:hypothetical protein
MFVQKPVFLTSYSNSNCSAAISEYRSIAVPQYRSGAVMQWWVSKTLPSKID